MEAPLPGSPSPAAAPKPNQARRAGSGRFWQAVVAVVAAAAFARTVGFGWVYDDQMEIVRNVLVHSLEHLPTLFTTTVWAGSGMETYLYRPLGLLTHALNYRISGQDPWSYHLVNVLLHAGVSLLVVRLGLLWGLTPAAAGVGGLLFALHPAHVEVAAAVFGRKDLLAGLFVLTMVLGHRAALARGGWRLVVPSAAFAAALLSKEVGAVGLLLVGAHDLLLGGDRRKLLGGRRGAGSYVSYLLVLLCYIVVRNQVTGTLGVPETSFYDNPLVGADPFSRLATALVVIGRGLLLLILPLTLSPDYSYNAIPLVQSPLDPRFLAALVVLALAGALLLRLIRKGRSEEGHPPDVRTLVLLGMAWYAITLLPVSNLLVTVGTIFGERLLYLPSVALCLTAAAAIHRIALRHRRAALAGTLLLLGGFTTQTIRYTEAWQDDLSLFRWAVERVPTSTKAHHKLGEELLRVGEFGDALRSLDRALAIAPGNEFATFTRGIATSRITARYLPPPLGSGTVGSLPRDPDLLYVLGQAMRERGELGRAADYWGEAIRLDPDHPESLADLAPLRILRGDTATALDYLERATRGRPSLASAWFNLAQLRLARREIPPATEALRQFLRVAGPRYSQQIRWARETLEALSNR